MKNIIFLFLILSQIVVAQQKQMSLEDAILGKYSYLQPQGIPAQKWRGSESFTYIESGDLWEENAKTGAKQQILSSQELKDISGNKIYSFTNYKWLNKNELFLTGLRSFAKFKLESKELTIISYEPGFDNLDFCEANSTVAFTKENDLYIQNNSHGLVRVTSDGGNGIVNGSYVHRREFGIYKGTFWSNSGNYLAFYRKDESMVRDYPLIDYMAREAELKSVKYPMAGMASHYVQLGIYNVNTKETFFLKTTEPNDHYLTNITWSPDEKSIYLMELNREQNHLKLNEYNVESGELVKTILEEKKETYVEPLTPIQFSNINPNEFYYLSRNDGWMHLYKYSLKSKELKQISKGDWEITELLGLGSKEKYAFVEATKDSPVERNLYRISLSDGKVIKLNREGGLHKGLLSPDGDYLVDSWSSKNVPLTIDLISGTGKSSRELANAENPLKNYQLGENTLFSIKANDGETNLFCRMIKPVDFDPFKKYPVIVYVYGGPHSQMVMDNWLNNARWWQYYMASKGFISFTMDNRGTYNRGEKFENIIHRQLGNYESQDQMKGIDYLKSLPYVDKSRIGVHGWSYGGFMTLNLFLKNPGVFKVAVAGGPVVDWSLYEIMYGERYMDTPESNEKGYFNANMLNFVPGLEGELMLVHGVQDETVVMQNSMKFLRECVSKKKQVDFFAYPVHPHNVRGVDRVHLMEKVSNYFLDNL